jgi:DNA-binding CsgD family transcriptional regulator
VSREVRGLPERDDARPLLDAVLPGPVEARVREQIVAETRGNPLELPRAATPAHLAGGFGLPGALEGRIEASLQAGAFGKALELLATAEAGPLDELEGARADWLRGQIAFASGPGSDAPPLLLKAARRLEPLDPGLARETYLDAWQAALFAGHLAVGGDLEEVSRAARALPPPPRPPRAPDVLLDGLALLVTDGPADAVSLIEATVEQAAAAGQGAAVTWAHWVAAVLHNGLGRYAEALAAARQAAGHKLVHISMWALPELVEAAARTGNAGLAGEALDQLSGWTQAGGTDWGLGVEARCRALLSDGAAADRLYREAIGRLGGTGMRPDLARAHLLYGEWLRRQRRRADARAQLRTARQLLDAIGMEAFAERARRELLAAGATARRHAVTAKVELTAQEAQIARLAAGGLSNAEIGARLFLSPRTAQYHLGKVFTKLDITSRNQLSRALSGR